ncbi:MAG: peptidoglycan DD-metalloendopeptidase family protein [Proteobacteria bacterium]|nr:peptidoglycan DD-metalloendopeptidase family protein [Pseudomonadota bacterium]
MPRLALKMMLMLMLAIAGLGGCSAEDPVDADLDEIDAEAAAEVAPAPEPVTPAPPPWTDTEVEVKRGSTIAEILQEQGLKYSEVLALVEASKDVHNLEKIRAGEVLTVRTDNATGSFSGLLYPLDRHGEERMLVLQGADGGFTAAKVARDVVRVPVPLAGSITTSLWDTAIGMGLGWDTVADLASIFEWEIDFNSQVREGDAFRLIVEEVRDASTGEVLRHDRVLAAEFKAASGGSFVGYRYEGSDGRVGYFNAEGMSSKKMFLKSPLKFSRISSGFGKRFHPVLKKWRSHNGVDYAAPSGTPIRAIGRGTVNFAGTKGGYGKHVRMRHNKTYQSSYSHLSRIAVRNGAVVEQGQVIGYVGSTGLATGPHLHFEFYVNGAYTNFLRQKFPRTEPINESERPAFEAMRDDLAPRLAAIPLPGRDTTVAAKGDDDASDGPSDADAGPWTEPREGR